MDMVDEARATQLLADYTHNTDSPDDCLCLACMAANDAALASQDTFTRMMDEAGLCRLARDTRAERVAMVPDRAWQRFKMAGQLVQEWPLGLPPHTSRVWARREAHNDTRQGFTRLELPAPDASLLPERAQW